MTKIAGTVILYYPDDSILSNIASYAGYVEKLFIVDNSENNNPALIEKLSAPNITYIHDGINQGIALRLNQVARMAIAEGFHHLLTMDQDSYFEATDISNYLTCIAAFPDAAITSMYGIEFTTKPVANDTCTCMEAEQLITSGSVLNLRLFEPTGGFDENLFIDEVDLEYCYRSIARGYKIVQFKNIFLHHNLGQVSYFKTFGLFKRSPRTMYSPLRIYYRVRNFLYVERLYRHKFGENCKSRKATLLNALKNNMIYGKQKMRLIKYILKAYSDFKKGKMGKFNG
jgi:rhamnosyltransferase